MTDEYEAYLLQQAQELESHYAEEAEQTRKASAEFKAKWPNHCPKCGGWGGFHQPSHSRWVQDDYDPCDGPDESNLKYCHRCGLDGMKEDDASGPCSHCGWNQDDGDPAAVPGALV